MSLSCDMILDIRHTSEFCVCVTNPMACVTNPMACVMKSYDIRHEILWLLTWNKITKNRQYVDKTYCRFRL